MLPLDIPDYNIILGPPPGWTEEECMTIKAYKGVDLSGDEFILTQWMPSKEDREAILAGRPICLKVIGSLMPPVALFTTDENLQPNV